MQSASCFCDLLLAVAGAESRLVVFAHLVAIRVRKGSSSNGSLSGDRALEKGEYAGLASQLLLDYQL